MGSAHDRLREVNVLMKVLSVVLLILLVPIALRAADASRDAFRKAHPILVYAVKPEDRARLEALFTPISKWSR